MDAKARNEAARDRAEQDPEAVADAAVRSATLPETLGLGEGVETRDGATYVKIRTDLTAADATRAAIVSDVSGNLWLRSRLTDRPGLTGFDSRANAEAICAGLAKLPVGDGLAALTLVVEAARLAAFNTKPRVLFGADLTGDCLDTEDEAAMQELATTAEGPDTAPMLDFGVRDPAGLVPAYLLDAYRAGGGASVSRGRGGPAPIRQRLWLHVLTAVESTDRDGSMRRFGPLRIGEHLIDHLWPYGWDYRPHHWPSLLNAIRAVNGQHLLYQGPGDVLKALHLIVFTDYPVAAPSPRALRAATYRGAITEPEGMAEGPTLSLAALEHAGTLSGPAQRLVVAWAFYRGRYLSRATPKGRRFTAPTIPRARRDEQGRYLDAAGAVILDKRGRPVDWFTAPRVVLLDAAGEPVAKPRQAARDRNPALDRAPAWSLDRWRAETGAHATVKQLRHEERQRHAAAFDALEAAGIIGYEKLPGGLYRPIPPGTVGRDPSRRELLEVHRRRLDDERRKRRNKRRNQGGPGLFAGE